MRSCFRVCGALMLLGCSGQTEAGAGERGAGEQSAGEQSAGEPRASEPDVSTEPAPQPSAVAEVRFSCEERASTEPDGLRRLTMTQYRNTVRDLTRWALDGSRDADAVVTAAGLEQLPPDRREPTPQDPHGSYRRLDQALDQSHVDETFRAASALAAALTTSDRLGTVAGACATDPDASNDEKCVTDFIRRFGARALRGPLQPEDERFYRAVYGGDPAPVPSAYADVITVMLSAPEFLYFVEHGDAAVPDRPGSYQLSAHELAARLSYHFWQTMPDDELWQAAEDGSLLAPEVLAQQVDRLLADERTRATMAELFSDWLGLDALPALDAHVLDPAYAAFAGSDLPGPELRQHVIDDALDMLGYYTWTAPAGVQALFTSELSFARSEDLARIYGAEPWDGSAPPPAMPASERAGLLTHAWFLASGSANTRPIPRGVFVRRTLLCDELAPPPANANAAVPPDPVAGRTTRQVVEELTEQPGTACASCHASVINPLGFAFEGFDALGRVRSEQRAFDADGGELGALPVDTTSVPQVTAGDESVSRGAPDLVQLLVRSGKLEACLARNYFRFTFGRYEDLDRDGCALERLRARLVESGRIRDMIAEAALLPELQSRRFEP